MERRKGWSHADERAIKTESARGGSGAKRRLALLTRLGLGLGLCALLLEPSAHATDIKGNVRGEKALKTKEGGAVRAPYWEEWNGFIEPKKPGVDFAREVSVVLIGAEANRDAITVLISNGALLPSTIVAQHGVPLRIRNMDDFTHKLSAAGLKGFEAMETSSGQSRELAMLQTGDFVISDQLAPYLKGHLHVLPKLTAVAQPQADGSFVFKDVHPGNYTLKVFRGAFEMSSSEIEVKDSRELTIPPISVDPAKSK
jgi:hypothetical protein